MSFLMEPAGGWEPWSQVPSGKGSGCRERVVVQVKVRGRVEVAQIPFDLSPRDRVGTIRPAKER